MAETETQKRIVDFVKAKARDWTTNDGQTLYFVEGGFADGDEFSAIVAKSTIDEAIASLKKIQGEEVEVEVDPNARDFNGVLTFKLKKWPGKPQQPGGGGWRGGGGGTTDEQVAVLAAASFLGPRADLGIIHIADTAKEFLAVLKTLKPAPAPQQHDQGGTGGGQTTAQDVAPGGANLAQVKALKNLAFQLGWTEDEALELAGVGGWAALSGEKAGELITNWQQQLDNVVTE